MQVIARGFDGALLPLICRGPYPTQGDNTVRGEVRTPTETNRGGDSDVSTP